jgi:hypothetical protein
MKSNDRSDFERLAAKNRRSNIVAEFWDFLRHNKKWWLLPILIVLLAMGTLLIAVSSPLAPFIYPFF